MYGDLINGICFTAFLPVYVYISQTQYPQAVGPRNTCLAFFFTVIFCWLSVWTKNCLWSSLALVAMCASIACMNLYQWPHADEVIVVPQYTWCLLIIASNLSLTLPYRIWLAIMAASNALGIVVVLQSFDKIPLLLAASAVYAMALFYYYYHRHAQGGVLLSAHAASLVLAGSYAYYVSYEMLSMYTDQAYTTTGGYNILRIGFFAAAGLAASGSFQKEIEFKQALEIQVAQKTSEIRAHAKKLRKVERALQASETAIAITGKEHEIEWSNAAFQRLITGGRIQNNKSPLDADGSSNHHEPIWNLMQLGDTDRTRLQEMFQGTHKQAHEIQMENRYIEAEVTSMEEDNGISMVVLKDVTEKRARLKAEKAAERQAAFAKAMNESMQTLSHELRTPLQGIMGMTSLLLDDDSIKLPVEVTECMSMVMTSSRLLLTLINNMLDSRKCDAGRMDEFNLGPVPLHPSLQEAKAFCQPFATISDVNLSFDQVDEFLTVKANPLRLQQIMINLISNAIKYGPENSTVSVKSRVTSRAAADEEVKETSLAVGCQTPPNYDDEVVIISVCDEGSGIRPEQSHRLFGRFSQLDGHDASKTAVGQPSGTGLGLSLCAEFVGRMHGQIWATNDPSKGCCFSFYLPLGSAVPADRATMVVAPESNISIVKEPQDSLAPNLAISRMRVLLVDDTHINLKVFRRMLTNLQVGKVSTVDSGEKAIRCIRGGEEFDLVLTDLHMPGMQGTDLSNAILQEPLVKHPVIVGITADQSASVETECREAGMAMVLHKPITLHGLADFFQHFSKSMV